MFCEFPQFRLVYASFIAVKMSSNTQRTSKEKPRSLKCRHFCLPFDNHNYCPSCREANRGDDPCVTLESSCDICSRFSDEQMLKIKNRKRYVRKQTLQRMMNSICWAVRKWNPLLDLRQTLRVLLTISLLLHHAPSPCVSSHCHLKLQLKLSLLPQVQLYNRKSSLKSNRNSKWGFSRLLCLRP